MTVIAFFERLPAALADTIGWGWHHPGAVAVVALVGVYVGLFGFVSTHFTRKGH